MVIGGVCKYISLSNFILLDRSIASRAARSLAMSQWQGNMVKATSVKDVDQHEAVKQIAHFLKKSGKVKVPEWSDIVKLGTNRQLAPVDPDWYYIRTASIARRLYIRSPAGVGALRTVFGGKKGRGSRPNHFKKGSGSVVRKALQTLEAIKWVEKHADGKGRVLSKQGRKDLDRIATELRQHAKPVEL